MSPSRQPITVASSSDADVIRATQEIADALEATIAAAPSQWYSFKPIWPPTQAEADELAARAARMLEGGSARADRRVRGDGAGNGDREPDAAAADRGPGRIDPEPAQS